MSADKPRFAAGATDMVRSLVVVLAFVAVGFAVFLPHGNQSAVKVVDYRPTLSEARSTAPYHVVAPLGLSSQWRATSAYVDSGTTGGPYVHWHLGFVTPRGDYAGIEQSNEPTSSFLSAQVGEKPAALGALPIAGTTWQQLRGENGRLALVRTAGKVTVIVNGSAGMGELVSLATALH